MTTQSTVPYEDAEHFLLAGLILGGLGFSTLKFSKSGVWRLGTENEHVSGMQFVVDHQHAEHGYIRVENNKVIDKALVSVATGKSYKLEKYPDNREYSEKKGWRRCVSIPLQSIESGEVCVYEPTYRHGIEAIGSLFIKYSYLRYAGKIGVPIISLESIPYEHFQYGLAYRPVLRVLSWNSEAELEENAEESEELLDDNTQI